jgi:hypothetical protein
MVSPLALDPQTPTISRMVSPTGIFASYLFRNPFCIGIPSIGIQIEGIVRVETGQQTSLRMFWLPLRKDIS